jgi:putative addiction module component (TIGR02574 family)
VHVSDIPELARLSTAEQILLVEDLWDQIAAEPSKVPVPENHREELDRRHEARRASTGRLLSLEELQDAIGRQR